MTGGQERVWQNAEKGTNSYEHLRTDVDKSIRNVFAESFGVSR